jgi:hypothetical protein
MKESGAVKLELTAPLFYIQDGELEPFVRTAAQKDDQLFCFQLDSTQCSSIEPDTGSLLGGLLFAGRALRGLKAPQGESLLQLPAGRYLFAQQREVLNREACCALAVEQQKDGLWERLAPKDRLYVRYLFEDGKPVTQILRPF